MPEIKPCPFCGENADTYKNEYWPDCAIKPEVSYGVGCKTPECHGAQDPDMAYHESPEKAIEAWNKRSCDCQNSAPRKDE